jgi:hypothetical protein
MAAWIGPPACGVKDKTAVFRGVWCCVTSTRPPDVRKIFRKDNFS